MNYEDALKKVTAVKPKENFMSIRLSYDCNIILPYKDGVSFLLSLNNAEQLKEPYNDQHRIAEFDRQAIAVTVMSHDEYIRIKIAALLGIKPDEVKPSELVTT